MAKLKLSGKQLEQFIKLLGADVELVADDQAKPDKEVSFDDAIAEVDDSRGKIIRPNLESEIRTELSSSIAGKHGGELRAHLRRLSGNVLKTSDLKDLKDEEAIAKFLEVMVGQKDQSLEEIRTQMQTALAEAESDKAKALGEKDTAFNNLKKQYTDKEIISLLSGELKGIPLKGGDFEVLSDLAKDYVSKRFNIHYDETGRKIELRDLTNPEKPALKGQVAIVVKDVLTEFAKATGNLKTDMRDDDPNAVQKGSEEGKTHDTSIMGGRNDHDADLKAFGAQMEA